MPLNKPTHTETKNDVGARIFRLATSDVLPTEISALERTVGFTFSKTGVVARDGHLIKNGAFVLDNYLTNPVFQWAHQSDELPIGKTIEIYVVGDRLRGVVQYADHPFAETVWQLVRGGFLNATSIGWLPLKWEYSKDRNRAGAIDFSLVELLEISQVPVPSDVHALADARSRGINTRPLYQWAEKVLDEGDMTIVARNELEDLRRATKMLPERRANGQKPDETDNGDSEDNEDCNDEQRAETSDWTVGASRDLPVADSDGSWDGSAAASRMLDDATTKGGDGEADKIDSAKAKRGFLVYDAANSDLRGSYKLPFADIGDGGLKAIPAGISAAESRLPQTDIPQDVKDKAGAVLDHYSRSHPGGPGSDDETSVTKAERQSESGEAEKFLVATRDLYHVGWLAMLLDDLDYLAEAVGQENEAEGDDSQIPAKLAAIVSTVGQILVDMTAEEVAELSQDDDDDVEDAEVPIGMRLIKAINKRFYRPAARTAMEAAYGALMDAASGHEWPDGILTAQQAGRLVRSLGKRFEIPDVERLPPVVDGVYRAVMEASAGRDWPTGVLTQDEGMRLCDVVCRHFGVIKPPPAPEMLEPAATPADMSLQAYAFVADMVRSGRMLSADNERKIRGAADNIMAGVGVLHEVCNAAAAIEDEQAGDDGDAGGVNGDTADAVTEMVLPIRATKPPVRQPTAPTQVPQATPSPVIGFEDAATRQRRARALALKQKTTYSAG